MSEVLQEGPRVSVGLATYNRPDGLRKALTALTGQTYRNLEILVSDNASPDPRVQEVIREFAEADGRIRAFRQPENLGFLRNFRFVFEQATSDYFMWAADDDICHPEFVEVCLANLLDPAKDAVLSFCHVRRVRTDGSVVNPDYADRTGPTSSSMLRRSFRFLYRGFAHCFYGIYRREYINEWFFARRFGYDHLALLVLLRHGNIHIDPRVLFTATVGGTGFQRENFHKYYDSLPMKIAVNLSSTFTWAFEFLRCIWITPYRTNEKLWLSLFTLLRFARPIYWRRLAGDVLTLFIRPGIWNFRAR